MLTRRGILKAFGLAALDSVSLAGYALALEPFRMRIRRYRLTPPHWPADLSLRIAVLTDIHACEPWMSVERIHYLADRTMALQPDLIVMLGDYAAGHRFVSDWVHSRDWSEALSVLAAPLGVHAIMGNHDWWEDRTAQKRGAGPVFGRTALERVGIPVYENDVVRLRKDGRGFWLAGLGDQLALLGGRGWGRRFTTGIDDLDGTLAKVTDDDPVILLAHEPDIFPRVPERVSLTLSGHTHGGQVRLFDFSPIVPSRYGNRYAYGHIVEWGEGAASLPRNMIVSAGLGCSIAPVRFGMPPEIVMVELGDGDQSGVSG